MKTHHRCRFMDARLTLLPQGNTRGPSSNRETARMIQSRRPDKTRRSTETERMCWWMTWSEGDEMHDMRSTRTDANAMVVGASVEQQRKAHRKCAGKGTRRQGIASKKRNMPCRTMPLLVQLRAQIRSGGPGNLDVKRNMYVCIYIYILHIYIYI